MEMVPETERVINLCLNKFNGISKSGKPVKDTEWTVLSCILQYNCKIDDLQVVSLGTGTKCIGKQSLSAHGDILNDSHAEVMCRRGFMRYLYHQILHNSDASSIFSLNRDLRKFELKNDISFHFFSTHAPCGDASIFQIETNNCENAEIPLKRAKLTVCEDNSVGECIITECQKEVSNVNFTGAKIISTNSNVPFDLIVQSIGEIRTKPGRGIHTLSVSCSDKMAKWNILGIQGALLYSLIKKPIYLESITFCCDSNCDVAATKRAIWTRFDNTVDLSSTPMKQQNPIIRKGTNKKFQYEKNDLLEPSPSSIVWCKVNEKSHEVAVAGKRQGVTKNKINTSSGRLLISKIEFLKQYLEILKIFNDNLKLFPNTIHLNKITYKEAKRVSVEYTNTWIQLKEHFFRNWTKKPNELENFRIDGKN